MQVDLNGVIHAKEINEIKENYETHLDIVTSKLSTSSSLSSSTSAFRLFIKFGVEEDDERMTVLEVCAELFCTTETPNKC